MKDLVMQTIRYLQGGKDAGREWSVLLIKILTSPNIGMKVTTTNKSVFSWNFEGYKSLLAVATDDMLFATEHKKCLDHLCHIISQYFSYTIQSGAELSFLNLRIIQSNHGISIDQTQHIERTILQPYWLDHPTNKIYFKESPFPLDTKFEYELYDALPLQDSDLVSHHKKHNGSLPKWVGALMHLCVWTRPDI